MTNNYQVRDSHFFIIDPLSIIIMGLIILFVIVIVIVFVLWNKRKNR